MKDISQFIQWHFTESLDVILTISGYDFVNNQPILPEDLTGLISDCFVRSRYMFCTIDLEGVDLFNLNIFSTLRLIQCLEEFYKDNGALKSITFINSTKFHRWVYSWIRLGLSRDTRNVIHFSSAGLNVS